MCPPWAFCAFLYHFWAESRAVFYSQAGRSYFLRNVIPSVLGPQWQEMVEPATAVSTS